MYRKKVIYIQIYNKHNDFLHKNGWKATYKDTGVTDLMGFLLIYVLSYENMLL